MTASQLPKWLINLLEIIAAILRGQIPAPRFTGFRIISNQGKHVQVSPILPAVQFPGDTFSLTYVLNSAAPVTTPPSATAPIIVMNPGDVISGPLTEFDAAGHPSPPSNSESFTAPQPVNVLVAPIFTGFQIVGA